MCLSLPASIAWTNACLGVLTGCLVLRAACGDNVPWRKTASPAVYALAFYCLVGWLSGALGVRPDVSRHLFYKDFHKLWALCVLLMALEATPFDSADLFLGSGFAAMALFGIWQALTQRLGPALMRAHGFVHPVTYGEQLALAALVAICLFDRERTAAGRRAAAGYLALLGVALALNDTRGALLGLLAGFAAACAVEARLRRFARGVAAAFFSIVVVWFLLPGQRSLSLIFRAPAGWDLTRTLVGDRRTLWAVAWRMFKDHPWTGVGPGNYLTLFTTYFQGVLDGERVWGSAHNIFLHQMAERGLLGLAALLLVFAALGYEAYRAVAARGGGRRLAALSCVAAFAVMNLSETAFQTELVTTLLLFVWSWGLAR